MWENGETGREETENDRISEGKEKKRRMGDEEALGGLFNETV